MTVPRGRGRAVRSPGWGLRRAGAAAFLLCVALSVVAEGSAAAGEAAPRARAAILFAPGPPAREKPSMLERIASHRELAVGFASSVLGTYSPEQALLDVSAGSRTWTSLYEGDPPEGMDLVREGRLAPVRGWAAAKERAGTPPADVVPGTLGQAIRDSGGATAYVGLDGRRNREAIVAADRSGFVDRASLTSAARVGDDAARAWKEASLLVARLPGGRDGSRALATLLAARETADLLVLVQRPGNDPRRLLALGVVGLGEGRTLRSDSTRTDGLVLGTDIVPTVLDHLGLPTPDDVSGQEIEAQRGRSVNELIELRDRLSDVGPRRWPVVLVSLGFAALLAALVGSAIARRHPRRIGRARARRGVGLRDVLVSAFLGALWLPLVLLVTGTLAPSRLAEILLATLLVAGLALATRLLVPWPASIAVPATATVLAHAVDLAFGSPWIARSVLGPNPILGARFYGVGNELEVSLAVIGLLGVGAALAATDGRALAWGLIAGGGLLAFVLSWGKLGADVGATLMLAAGTAAAAVYALGEGSLGRRAAIVVAAPALALAALAAVDLVTGGNAHFTRSVLRAGGLDELAEVAQRRLELSYGSLGRGLTGPLVAAAVIALIVGIRRRRQIGAALDAAPGLRAALVGALVAVVAGALSNDSGPMILLIGTVYLALFAAYVLFAAKPPTPSASGSPGTLAASIAPCGSPSSARTPGRSREA